MSGTIVSYRQQIRNAIQAAIQSAATAAGTRVFGPRELPTDPSMLPCVIVSSPPQERAQSLVKGQPSFETVAYFPVTARVAAQTVESIDAQLETLIVQIKQAVFAYQPLIALTERAVSVDTSTALLSEGQYKIAEANIVFAFEFPEFYSPSVSAGTPLTQISGSVTDQASGSPIGSFVVTPTP